VVSFTPQLLDPQVKNPQYPLDRKLGGPQSQFGQCQKEKFPALARNQTLIIQSTSLQPVVLTELSWLYNQAKIIIHSESKLKMCLNSDNHQNYNTSVKMQLQYQPFQWTSTYIITRN
jgi:hypothetical protein